MKKTNIILTLALLTLLLMPAFISLQAVLIDPALVQDTAKNAGYDATSKDNAGLSNTISQNVGTIVKVFLSFIGAIFFLLIIFSGIQWMTAGGNDDQVSKAKTRVLNATVGLAITIAAYFITWFISNALL